MRQNEASTQSTACDDNAVIALLITKILFKVANVVQHFYDFNIE